MLIILAVSHLLCSRLSHASVPFNDARRLLNAALDPARSDWTENLGDVLADHSHAKMSPAEHRTLGDFVRGRTTVRLGLTREQSRIGRMYSEQRTRLETAIQRLGAIGTTSSNAVVREIYNSLVQLHFQSRERWAHRWNFKRFDEENLAAWAAAEQFRNFVANDELSDGRDIAAAEARRIGVAPATVLSADRLFVTALTAVPNDMIWTELISMFVREKMSAYAGAPPTDVAQRGFSWTLTDDVMLRPMIEGAVNRLIEASPDPAFRLRIEGLRRELLFRWTSYNCEELLDAVDPLHPLIKSGISVAGIGGLIAAELLTKGPVKTGVRAVSALLTGGSAYGAKEGFHLPKYELVHKLLWKGGKLRKVVKNHGKPFEQPASNAKAATILGFTSNRWAGRMTEEARSVESLNFSDRLEHMQTFVIKLLLESALDRDGGFAVKWNSTFYPKHRFYEWGRGRASRDRLVAQILAKLDISAGAFSWSEHRGSDASPEPLLLSRLHDVYVALARLNKLPRSPLVRVAIEVLLEVEVHATKRDHLTPLDPTNSYVELFDVTPDGVRLRKPVENAAETRRQFLKWVKAQSANLDDFNQLIQSRRADLKESILLIYGNEYLGRFGL